MYRYKDMGYTLEEIIEEVFRQHNDIFQIENLKQKPDEGLFVLGTSGTGKSFSSYDAFLANLLLKVETEGILVKRMQKEDNFIFFKLPKEDCKLYLGAVPKKNSMGKITNVYVAYEDYSGKLKYYDFPQ